MSGFFLISSKAFLPTTNLPALIIGHGVALMNIARQTCAFWHIRLTLATFMPILDRVMAFSLRLHSSSWRYKPDETPKPTSCTPPDKDLRQDCCPVLIKLGATAVLAGICLPDPAPLYVLLTLLLFEFDVFKSPSMLVPSPLSSVPGSNSPSSLTGGGSTSGTGSTSGVSCPKAGLATLINSISRYFFVILICDLLTLL